MTTGVALKCPKCGTGLLVSGREFGEIQYYCLTCGLSGDYGSMCKIADAIRKRMALDIGKTRMIWHKKRVIN